METAINDQFFAMSMVQVRFIESYLLSEQYTPENLMKEYNESILLELKNHSVVEHNIFMNATWRFENGNTLVLKFEDSVIASLKEDSIVAMLRQIFEERCHVPIQVETE